MVRVNMVMMMVMVTAKVVLVKMVKMGMMCMSCREEHSCQSKAFQELMLQQGLAHETEPDCHHVKSSVGCLLPTTVMCVSNTTGSALSGRTEEEARHGVADHKLA